METTGIPFLSVDGLVFCRHESGMTNRAEELSQVAMLSPGRYILADDKIEKYARRVRLGVHGYFWGNQVEVRFSQPMREY